MKAVWNLRDEHYWTGQDAGNEAKESEMCHPPEADLRRKWRGPVALWGQYPSTPEAGDGSTGT